MFSDNPSADLDPAINPKQILSSQQLNDLNQKSDLKGWLHLVGHLAIMGGSGILWGTQMTNLWIALPALAIYGFSFAAMFAPLHECGHRIAFASDRTGERISDPNDRQAKPCYDQQALMRRYDIIREICDAMHQESAFVE